MTLARSEQPAYSLNNMKVLKDILYYKNQKLDVTIPDGKILGTFVHFHGGGIVEGDKSDVQDLMNHLANKGLIMINANYSLYPNTKFPEFLIEAAHAVKYAFDNVESFGGDKNHIYLSGQSAGAYIIMMLATNPEYLKSVGLSNKQIKGYVSDSGQMIDHFNVQKYEKGLDPWLQRITELSPLYYITPDVDLSSILLICYENDMLNRKEQNRMLYNLVKHYNKDIDINYVELPGGHVEGSCKKDKDNEYPYVKVVLDWINQK